MSANKAIRRLVARINDLVATVQYQDEQIEALQRELSAQLDRERQEAQFRDWEREDAVRSLERARSWGDSYAEEKALRKLKYL